MEISKELSKEHTDLLKKLMIQSAKKGNLANAAIVLESQNLIVSSESIVNSNKDATAHAERIAVRKACNKKGSALNLGFTMVTVIEPCLMCISACSWANFREIYYFIPAKRYIDKIPWVSEAPNLDKNIVLSSFKNPIKLIHLPEYEDDFSKLFEEEMKQLLKH